MFYYRYAKKHLAVTIVALALIVVQSFAIGNIGFELLGSENEARPEIWEMTLIGFILAIALAILSFFFWFIFDYLMPIEMENISDGKFFYLLLCSRVA